MQEFELHIKVLIWVREMNPNEAWSSQKVTLVITDKKEEQVEQYAKKRTMKWIQNRIFEESICSSITTLYYDAHAD